ncbi:ribonuclease HII [Corynebacterium pelargi]|uniref:Ribonuclease HII n=1 Tax=Corynebacterium pelargi TaxID=1471400 RepID=A0A410W843_9CORY|nr:ribonuclease HII [Corynebacterium pelargi]QAU52116.1 Ribonuclease HII [Corynebacterium pelargi]GGG70019.1 ribonuclease HII [Corynebacterium pelargi]
MRTLKQLRTFDVALDKAGLGPVAGVDEAGRGACCGPISIAACILPPKILPALDGLTDSKALSPARRNSLFDAIRTHALAYSIVHISAQDIDAHGIQHANISGMRRAVAQLHIRPGSVLSDAMRVEGMETAMLPMIGGDAASRSIAAASVLAKVSRDRAMEALDLRFPNYGLTAHKGYGTKSHMDAVRRHGASEEHRYSYANVQAAHRHWLEQNT